jgi:hypothetical protein
MNKIWKFLQYGYLVIAVICFVEGAIKLTNKEWVTGGILLATAILVIILFMVKRRFRKRIEARQKQ